MRHIYHLVRPEELERQLSDDYRADSLATEGFIHCSNLDQVVRVANRWYAAQPGLCVLVIDVTRLTSPLLDEDPGVGELFPHVYGPINRNAIVDVHSLQRRFDGRWFCPALPMDV